MAAALVGATAGSAAAAHFNPYGDSVDGRDIRYEDNTKWDDSRQWAEARWEEIPGDAEMLPDNWKTVADLEIKDYNLQDGFCGYWSPRSKADLLNLNDAFYNGASTNNRRDCTVHELGHAFGLGDHPEAQYDNAVMDSCPVESCNPPWFDRPQAHDKDDFSKLWGTS